MNNSYKNDQKLICKKYKTDFCECDLNLKIGLSRNIKHQNPIHGLRHPPEKSTTGWYIWSGELSDKDNFFLPFHAIALEEWCPEIIKYLALPPGYRFLTDLSTGYEDIWFDESLLDI